MVLECSASSAWPTTSTRDTSARHASPRDVTTTTDSDRIEVSVCVIPCSTAALCESGTARRRLRDGGSVGYGACRKVTVRTDSLRPRGGLVDGSVVTREAEEVEYRHPAVDVHDQVQAVEIHFRQLRHLPI